MIVSMQKVRILGPRGRLPAVVDALQDFGGVHLSRPASEPPVVALRPAPRHTRHVPQVEAALDDIEEALARLGGAAASAATPAESVARAVRLARRAKRAAVALAGEERSLRDERERLGRLEQALETFVRMGASGQRGATRTFLLVLAAGTGDARERLERALADAIGASFTLEAQPLPDGELAVALVVPRAEADRVEALLPEAGVHELEAPELHASGDLASGLQTLRRRAGEIDGSIERVASRRRRLGESLLPGLSSARMALHDWLARSAAFALAGATPHAFVLEGWLPASAHDALVKLLGEREGERVVVEEIAREDWSARDVPVAIQNPRMFRPFEVLTRRLPLPRYGTIDPTPFIAVFFPMFFGLILGDVGYGALLGILAAVLWLRSAAGGTVRSIAEIAGACAAFSITFGLLFGELFGDLGQRLFGMRAAVFSRERAFVPFLELALAIGFVHVVLGLVLGALASLRSDPRESLGRGLAAAMLVLTLVLLLAAVNVLPHRFFTPVAVALIVIFPVLIAVEGMLGAVELLSRVSNILSYARIMALGTASVMLAVVANQMVGTFGGAVVGVLFATLFHLVNFALGVFSPTIHALRLHFVEFFGTFYSPGGQIYRPFRHWRPADASAPQSA